MIDGARINDQFGLNYTGLASFFNPLSLDTIEQRQRRDQLAEAAGLELI